MALLDFFRLDSSGVRNDADSVTSNTREGAPSDLTLGDAILGLLRDQPGITRPVNPYQVYLSSGFAQTIVNCIADDVTREWFKLETSLDEQNQDIARQIMNRLDELDLKRKIRDLVRYARIYREGAILYYAFKDAEAARTAKTASQSGFGALAEPPSRIAGIDYLKVISQDSFSLTKSTSRNLEKHSVDISVDGQKLHPTRYQWLTHNWNEDLGEGISVIDQIYLPLAAFQASLWSSAQISKEFYLKVVKTDAVHQGSPTRIAEYLAKLKHNLNSKSILAMGNGDELIKQVVNLSGIKDLHEFNFSALAGAATIPKMRLVGNAQGTLAGSDNDLITYYDNATRFQENEITRIVDRTIGYVLQEPEFAQYENLDWEIKWKPLWTPSAREEAEIEFRRAQTDQIYITQAVLAPTEVRERRFKDLETFTEQPMNPGAPVPVEDLNTETDLLKTENEKLKAQLEA